MTPHACPVCKGVGKLWPYPPKQVLSNSTEAVKCHGCNGKGWVACLRQDETVYVTQPVYQLDIHAS